MKKKKEKNEKVKKKMIDNERVEYRKNWVSCSMNKYIERD